MQQTGERSQDWCDAWARLASHALTPPEGQAREREREREREGGKERGREREAKREGQREGGKERRAKREEDETLPPALR